MKKQLEDMYESILKEDEERAKEREQEKQEEKWEAEGITKTAFQALFNEEPEKIDGFNIVHEGIKLSFSPREAASLSTFNQETKKHWHLTNACPYCNQEVQSIECFSLKDIARQYKNFQPEDEHQCKERKEENRKRIDTQFCNEIDELLPIFATLLANNIDQIGIIHLLHVLYKSFPAPLKIEIEIIALAVSNGETLEKIFKEMLSRAPTKRMLALYLAICGGEPNGTISQTIKQAELSKIEPGLFY